MGRAPRGIWARMTLSREWFADVWPVYQLLQVFERQKAKIPKIDALPGEKAKGLCVLPVQQAETYSFFSSG